MNGSALANDQQTLLVDSLKAAERETSKAQARRVQLMVEFADARKQADRHRIHDIESSGGEPRYKPGEFAAMEIGLAVTATKRSVQKDVARGRRLQTEAPDAWDAWIAGDINEAKAAHISHAMRKLVRDDSKKMLNMVVVEAAVRRTPELLRRWLNRFVAQVEPDLSDERIRRSLEDRYVSVRPDLDGVSFLSACLPSMDAASIDLVLDALVGITDPGDARTKQQRRADAMVDLLLGRISNGWHSGECTCEDGESGCDAATADQPNTTLDGIGDGEHREPEPESGSATETDDPAWDEEDWDLPASAFRPDPTAEDAPDLLDEAVIEEPCEDQDPSGGSVDSTSGVLNDRATNCAPCPGAPAGAGGHGQQPPRVSIGVVVSIQSLFGFTDTPGELADGSAHVPAELIRELAGQPGTLLYRLLTDPIGNLLDVTEMGRFASRKLAAAVRYRDAVCSNPICHVAAHRCDLDHVIPHPDGPTAGWNLDPKCRSDHRAKTHAGFTTKLAGGQATWITPTGHRYTTNTGQLPVDEWPCDSG